MRNTWGSEVGNRLEISKPNDSIHCQGVGRNESHVQKERHVTLFRHQRVHFDEEN